MLDIYTTTDAMNALAKAIQYNDIERFLDIREAIEYWLQGEDEKEAWMALLDQIERKFD